MASTEQYWYAVSQDLAHTKLDVPVVRNIYLKTVCTCTQTKKITKMGDSSL